MRLKKYQGKRLVLSTEVLRDDAPMTANKPSLVQQW